MEKDTTVLDQYLIFPPTTNTGTLTQVNVLDVIDVRTNRSPDVSATSTVTDAPPVLSNATHTPINTSTHSTLQREDVDAHPGRDRDTAASGGATTPPPAQPDPSVERTSFSDWRQW